jgi:AcrR family transcriptional regulator
MRLTKDQRVEQLMDIAQVVFAERGFDGTSIEQIARAAGVSRPIVYEHFGSKDGIYLACLRRARAQLDEALTTAVAGVDDMEQRLAAGVAACFRFIEQDPARWAVLFNGVAVSGTVAAEATRLRMGTVAAIADMIHAARPQADRREVEAFANALSGAGEQLERWWRLNPDVSREEISGYLHRFAWHGLSHLAPGSTRP